MSPLLLLLPVAGCVVPEPHHDHDRTPTTEPVPVLHDIAMSEPITCADPDARAEARFDRVEDGDWALRTRSAGAWGVTIADLDQDGWLDLMVPSGLGPMLFMGAADGLHAGHDRLPMSAFLGPYRGTAAADVDGDGDLDLLHVGRDVADLLLLNDGTGTFSARLLQEGPRSMGGAFGDVDGDGDLDLAIANGTSISAPVLLLNDGAGHFTPHDELLPFGYEAGSGFVVGIVDLDQDGRPDLYRANDAGPWGPGNRVAWNRGGMFEEDPNGESGLDVKICSMGLGIGDLNGDLAPDVALSDCSGLHLLESTPMGVWIDHAQARGFTIDPAGAQDTSWGVELADLDNDGLLDAYVAFGYLVDVDWEQAFEQRDGVYLQQPDGSMVDVSEDWGIELGQSRGFAVGDVNNDGWLDIVKQDWHGSPEYYRSRCGSEAWLRVALDDPGPNRFAIGAKVVAYTEDRAIARWIHAGGTSVSSGGPPEAHFGLGDADRVDLEVTWPDGEVGTWEGVPTRRIVTLTR